MKEQALIRVAIEARKNAYAPYSGFAVGAALLCEDGRVFTGANVENASYGATICAERVAYLKAVSEGCRAFATIAIVADGPTPPPPCGACRQVMAEFGTKTLVVMANLKGAVDRSTVGELFPRPFTGEQLTED